MWGYEGIELCFLPHFKFEDHGNAKFSNRCMTLTMRTGERVDFLYSATKSITTEDAPSPSITFTLIEAPRFYKVTTEDGLPHVVMQMSKLSINGRDDNRRSRVSSLGEGHSEFVGSCFVYRIGLNGASKVLRKPLQNLKFAPGIPPIIHQQVRLRHPIKSPLTMQKTLTSLLLDSKSVPWKLAYQLRRLTMNGSLTPSQILELLPEIRKVHARSGTSIAAAAVRKLYTQIPYPGLDVEANEFDLQSLIDQLRSNEDQVNKEEAIFSNDGSVRTSENLALIHRVIITPSGFYLYGPDPEPMNRVLRKYPKNHEYFIRVQFADEDGEPVRFNPRVSNESIFQGRFKQYLQNGFTIAGRKFDFLGFSHSSLRAQSCWFMSPFAQDGSLMYDRILIQQLGDFTKIRCPAKCAARIGQAFSETPTAVPLAPGTVQTQQDIERGSRVFSDGVGTLSKSVMHKIWDAHPEMRKSKPTCFQIRYKGKLRVQISGRVMFWRIIIPERA